MQKLLALVLSVSILCSSVTPAWSQVREAGRGVIQGLRQTPEITQGLSSVLSQTVNRRVYTQLAFTNSTVQARVAAGQLNGLVSDMLTRPAAESAAFLRSDFAALSLLPQAVSAQERAQAVTLLTKQLTRSPHVLRESSYTDLSSLLEDYHRNPTQTGFIRVQEMLADAAALAQVGTREQFPALLSFYEQSRGTPFEDTVTLITARSLLRTQAYDLLSLFLVRAENKDILAGTVAYIQMKGLPVEIPATFAQFSIPAANEKLAAFLSTPSRLNQFHADPSLEATRDWLDLQGKLPPLQEKPVLAVRRPVEEIAQVEPAAIAEVSPEEPVQQVVIAPVSAAVSPAVPQAPVVLVPTELPQTPAIPTVKIEQSSSREGIVYSGIPVFALANLIKRIIRRFKPTKNYDRSSFPVDLIDKEGNVQSLPFIFSIGPSLYTNGYDRIVFHEEPSFENKYIIEMHDHGKEPIKMGHFYMALYNSDIGPLVQAAQKAGVTLSLKLEHTANVNYEMVEKAVYDEKTGDILPLKISLQLGKPLWAREMSQAFSHWLESVGLPGTYSPHILANAKFVLRENGEIWVRLEGQTELVSLPDAYYIRLPKNQVENIVKSVPFMTPGRTFDIVLSPTSNRVNMVARDASLTNVSLGKTMGSVVYNELGMAQSDAKSLMFGINYVLPGFASLMTPVLKKYGEKKLLTLSLGMSVASGVLASLGGFYGFVEQMALGPVQKGLFISALLLMSGASILKQLVSNMLIRANRGEVVLTGNTQKAAKTVVAQAQETGGELLQRRLKEFFTKKSEVSLRDIALYNLGFVYKNIGTLAFLSAPFLINYGVKGLTGTDLGIDYSISFPLYAGYSTYVMWKVLRSKLRDAYTAKNLLQSQQMLQNMLKTGAQTLGAKEVSQTVIDDVARSFKDSLDALAFAHVKLDPSKTKKLLYRDAKGQILSDLEQSLINDYHLSAALAKERVGKVESSLKMQENTLGNMWKMLKAPGVTALASAMTLATVHEFVISSSFAGTMKELIHQGELANLLIATSLYVPFIIGRLGGNWISRRISPQTMYVFCSSLSALGTVIMATAGNSVAQTISGAAIASLGVGNFFTQMYDYIMNKYPKQNREISSILALTMGLGGLGAIPAGYMTAQTIGGPLDLWYAGAMLAASLVLTPGMIKGSSLVKAAKYWWERLTQKIRGNSGGDALPPAAAPAQ